MCDFCENGKEKILKNETTSKAIENKVIKLSGNEVFVSKTYFDGNLVSQIECLGKIKFCPYCGRGLA